MSIKHITRLKEALARCWEDFRYSRTAQGPTEHESRIRSEGHHAIPFGRKRVIPSRASRGISIERACGDSCAPRLNDVEEAERWRWGDGEFRFAHINATEWGREDDASRTAWKQDTEMNMLTLIALSYTSTELQRGMSMELGCKS